MEKNIENIVSVSSLPGLYYLESSRSNGLIIKDMDSGVKQFVSVRKHQFTPLRSIAIYTYSDSTPIEDIFKTMVEIKQDHNISELLKASNNDLANYFRIVLPEYDEDRVYPSDMKKVLKWFDFLDKRDFFSMNAETNEKSTSEDIGEEE
ncbi:MAG: DUF5606 domain-containing protein [Saprospiraceae bacterium]|jgi:hypothetical protein|nr:DUF5606 domain-containing protein [Candidatus Brachybacter algidus]